MQGILSGGLLVVAFAAVAGLALLVVLRLYRISRPGRSADAQPPGGHPPGAQPVAARLPGRRSPGLRSPGLRSPDRAGGSPDA